MTNAEEACLLQQMKEDRELLAEFGLSLSGFDPGVTAFIKSSPQSRGDGWAGEPIEFSRIEWKWLKPLLVELQSLRLSNHDLREALQDLLEVCSCQNGCAPDDMTCATNKARFIIGEKK